MTNGEAASATIRGWLTGLLLSPFLWVLLLDRQRSIVIAWFRLNLEAATGGGQSYSLRALAQVLLEHSTAFHSAVLISIFILSATLLSHYFKWAARDADRRINR